MSFTKKEKFDTNPTANINANYVNLLNKINSNQEFKNLLLSDINKQITTHNVNKLIFKDKLDKIENKIVNIR